jgi:S-adenosyl methyltransferase
MSDEGDGDAPRRVKANLIDVTVPNAARAANFLRGGKDNFAADRKAIRAVAASAPAIERIPAEARAFRHRVIRYLVAEAGIRQFLDIGTGLVPPGITHEVAQAIDPGCRIVYTDSDPMVLSHARALIRSVKGGAVSCVSGDIADVDAIVASAVPTLDLSEPVAVLLLSTLAHVPTKIAAARAVSSLMTAVPSGSYVAIYHLANDLDPGMPLAARHWNKTVPKPLTLRSRADVLALVSGLELIPPGVVPVTGWRPDLAVPPAPAAPSEPGPPAAPSEPGISVAPSEPGASADPAAGPARPAPVQPASMLSAPVRPVSVRPVPVQPVPVHGVVARKP